MYSNDVILYKLVGVAITLLHVEKLQGAYRHNVDLKLAIAKDVNPI